MVKVCVLTSRDAGMHAQLRADQDVALSYQVRGVWMPEEASVEILVDSLRVYQTDQRWGS